MCTLLFVCVILIIETLSLPMGCINTYCMQVAASSSITTKGSNVASESGKMLFLSDIIVLEIYLSNFKPQIKKTFDCSSDYEFDTCRNITVHQVAT